MMLVNDLSPTNPTFPNQDGPINPSTGSESLPPVDGVDAPANDDLLFAKKSEDGPTTTVKPDGTTTVDCPAGQKPVSRPVNDGRGVEITCEKEAKKGDRTINPGGAPILAP